MDIVLVFNACQTPAEYRRQMEPVVGYSLDVTGRGLTANAYDGMWALALGLHDAQVELGRPLDSFQYGDADYADVVGRFVQRQKFEGVSVIATSCDTFGSMELHSKEFTVLCQESSV